MPELTIEPEKTSGKTPHISFSLILRFQLVTVFLISLISQLYDFELLAFVP
jgi:hypothetical protein